jgi:cation diffusion facilitator CzcD-associated flavoprotein CzcO
MSSIDTKVVDQSHFDVLIVGAGISGINSAYRIQSELPHYNYAIIESRSAMGGTWDLFRYPGIRFVCHTQTYIYPANRGPQIRLGPSYIRFSMAPMERTEIHCRWTIDPQIYRGIGSGIWN